VRGVTFTRQYPDFLFPAAASGSRRRAPAIPVAALLDSIGRELAPHRAASRAFAPGAVILKWWVPFFAPAFASSVGPLRGAARAWCWCATTWCRTSTARRSRASRAGCCATPTATW
jgi:hypothetical protein